jgi:hypothetical protein
MLTKEKDKTKRLLLKNAQQMEQRLMMYLHNHNYLAVFKNFASHPASYPLAHGKFMLSANLTF